MSSRRKAIRIATLTTLTTGAFGLMAGPAFAHGYVDSPASRQAQCAKDTVSCGEITYEPQSVEGPKGQQSCSAGLARFAELDDDAKGWKVTDVGTSADFTWTYTARHRTANWQYFIDGEKIAEFDGGNQQPGETTTHKLDLSGYSGEQKILAVWNIGDTANAFYSCVDVNIGEGSGFGSGDAGGTTAGDAGGTTTGDSSGSTTGDSGRSTTGDSGRSTTAVPAPAAGHEHHHGPAVQTRNVAAEEDSSAPTMWLGGLFAAVVGVGVGKIMFNRRKRPETYREL